MFKNMKKLTAILLSAIMILSTMTTIFAEELPEGAAQTEATNAITEQSEALSVKSGETATFTVKAEGRVRSYRWEVSKDGGNKWNKLDAKTDTLSIEARTENDGDLYRCAVTFKNYKVAYSEPAKLNVAPVTLSETVSLENVSVDANYDREAFSEAVELGAEVLNEEDAKYAEAADALAEAGYDYENMMALDIHFLSQLTGAEVEPDGDVDISINLNKELLGEDVDRSSIMISHITENGVEIISGFVSEPEPELPGDDNGAGLLKVDFTAKSFSTYTISWRTGGWGYSYHIHYVDTDGNSVTPTREPTFSNNYMFLIYDVEGYEYDSSHYRSRTGTAIQPIIHISGGDREYTTGSTDWWSGDLEWSSLRDDIYIVYKAKTATQGGTPDTSGSDETWPSQGPEFSKSSVNNGDGTNTITLSIVGPEKHIEKTAPADVIVVFDVSGSMSDSMNGQTRLARAKTAVNTMANTLLNAQNSDVRMALISFSTDATIVQGFTDNYTTYSGKVNSLSADGGTNWEKALYLANQMEVRAKAATFVIFVTDGDPTFRMSRGNVSDANLDMYEYNYYQYYRNNCVFGEGNDDSDGRNFSFAVTQVSAIANKNKEFYAIGISNSVTKVQNLTTQGGVDADHAFVASDSAAMNAAFQSITNSIKSVLGFGDVAINDGITELTNSEMKVMESVDPNSFKYYRWGGDGNKYGTDEAHKTEWTTRQEDGCAPATYNEDTGAVQWNMGAGFQLENNVHYVVEFRVWASQDAYDLVADLNNGVKVYEEGHDNSITAEERAQVVEITAPTATTQGSYSLKTNTNEVSATYKKTTKTGETVTISDNQPITATYHEGTQQPIALESMKLTIKKEFEDDLTAGEDRRPSVTLVLYRRNSHQSPEPEFEEYAVPQNGVMSAAIVLNEENNWSYEFYVAPGVEVNGEILEHGYDYTIKEPDIDYHYGLIEEIINPMVKDGEDAYYGDGYLLDDEETVHQYIDQSLTAVNRVKSGIDIKKVLVDTFGQEITPDIEFTIKGQILDADGHPFTWQEGDDINKSGAYHKYDKNGTRIVYKGHFASTANIEFTLKPGEYVRFINVPDGCTFEFYEVIPSGDAYEWYTLDSITALTQHRVSAGGEFTQEGDVQPVVEDQKAKLTTGVVGNKQYSITFNNKTEKGEWFYVYHSSDNTIEQIFVTDDRVTVNKDSDGKVTSYSFNMVNETKAGYLYGGYFRAYKGAGLTDAEITELTYTSNGTSGGVYGNTTTTSFWATDTGTNKKPYTGLPASAWSKAYTESGLGMTVTGGTVYYLKEVPEQYFRPALYYVYDDRAEGKPLLRLYLMLPADDGYYQYVGGDCEGMTLATSNKLYSTFKVTNFDGSQKPYTVKEANDTLPRGFLAVWEMNDLLVANKTYTWTPFFVTRDNVKVTSITTRTISIGNGGHGEGGFTATDAAIASTATAAGN